MRRIEKPDGLWEEELGVRLAVFSQIMKAGASLMGDEATGRRGLLEMVADLHAALDENLLGLSGVTAAEPDAREPESEFFGNENEFMVRKVVDYTYTRDRRRP